VSVPLFSALVTAICAVYVARRAARAPASHVPGARSFLAVLVLEIAYSVCFACEGVSRSLTAKLFWDDLQLAFTVALPLALLNFAQRWVGGERPTNLISRRGWFALALLPLAACLFVYSDPWHGQARADAHLTASGPYLSLAYSFAPIEWATFLELYGLCLYGVLFTLARTWRRSGPYRAQAFAVALAVSMPVIGSIPGVFFNVLLFGQRDAIVVLFFAAGSLVVTWALYRRGLFDLAPVAYDLVLDQLPLPIIVVDAQERIVEVNPAARELFGFDSAVTGEATESAERRAPEFGRAMEALRARQAEVRIGERIFELRASELHGGRGRTGRVIQLHDVSERHRAEDLVRLARDALELRVAERTDELSLANQALLGEMEERRAAEEAQKLLQQRLEAAHRLESLGRLAGGVAHDFNNLLTVILGNASLLQAYSSTAGDRELLSEIEGAAQSAASLTQQLLAFARRQVIDPRVIDLGGAVEASERMLSRLLGEDIRIERQQESGPLRVRLDPSQLEQILVNLCLNARDAMPKGGRLTIKTSFAALPPRRPIGREESPAPEADGYAVISVADTGTGIAPAMLDRIFEPFFTTKPLGKGTGLGLASVYGAAEQAGGLVSVESEPGRGSTFHVYFPRALEAARASGARAAQAAGEHGTIALVEDQELVRHVTSRQLQRMGYDVLSFASAKAALAELPPRLAEVDLLVSDVIMPEISGPHLVAELRRQRPSLPVLFLSGYAEDALADRGAATAGAPVLAKP
ncbi:MAG TPA: histidine kinase N-terminal 7TM domain-containing protein, partial [Polyangiaceae bacterium]|nr:histidine kinase N-terminal 7TM domain-containing protein [Polyangiaceae bacterium]